MKPSLKGIIAMICLVPLVDSFCYSRQPHPYRNYSSFTMYPKTVGNSFMTDNHPGCRPISLFVLARHNIRNPSANSFEKMREKLPLLREKILQSYAGTMCQEDKDNLRYWSLRNSVHDLHTLTKYGYQDAYEFGQRIQNRFASLLNVYSSQDFIIMNSYQNSTWNTAVAFTHGMFNDTEATNNIQGSIDPKLLSFSSVCRKQLERDDLEEELEEFLELDQVERMMQRIRERLGLTKRDLNFDDTDTMYQTCALEYALYRRSPWCAAFGSADLKVMEFKHDMTHFHKFGPSDDINEEQTCVLIKNFVNNLNVKKDNLPKGVFYFSDDNAVLPFLTKLGLFKEDEMEAEDIDEMIQNFDKDDKPEGEAWRMSSVNPFGSNIIIVLYKCQQDYRIKALLNEREIVIPPCRTSFCSLSDMIRRLKDWSDDCDFDDICDTASKPIYPYTVVAIGIVCCIYNLVLY